MRLDAEKLLRRHRPTVLVEDRLVAEVFDGVVFLILPVQRGPPDLLGQLSLLLDEPLFEVREPFLPHLDLLPDHNGAHSRDRR